MLSIAGTHLVVLKGLRRAVVHSYVAKWLSDAGICFQVLGLGGLWE